MGTADQMIAIHRKAMENQKKALIDKACKYLKNALYEVASGVTNSFDIMSIENTTMDDFISSFRKAMEEQV